MNEKVRVHLDRLLSRYSILRPLESNLIEAYTVLHDAFASGGKLLTCGNGGSAADSDHIVGELMKGFMKPRRVPSEHAQAIRTSAPVDVADLLIQSLQQGLPAFSLTVHGALGTAVANDLSGEMVFAQQVYASGRPGDVLLGISTSGNSRNVLYALYTAKALGMRTIGLTGESGGRMRETVDVLLNVSAGSTPDIQELHLPIYHALCIMLEEAFF